MSLPPVIGGLEIRGPLSPRYNEILTPAACAFVAGLATRFDPRRRELLARRAVRQSEFDAGKLPDFPPGTAALRAGDWQVPPPPPDLLDRRTEITGPVDRKMAINALNSGAQCWMADFEDSNSPTWENVIEGQLNLRDAIRRTITYTSPEGKPYALNGSGSNSARSSTTAGPSPGTFTTACSRTSSRQSAPNTAPGDTMAAISRRRPSSSCGCRSAPSSTSFCRCPPASCCRKQRTIPQERSDTIDHAYHPL